MGSDMRTVVRTPGNAFAVGLYGSLACSDS
jgi:hypothetical protein